MLQRMMKCWLVMLVLCSGSPALADGPPSTMQERMVEWTIESKQPYPDPFNDVEVDVTFAKDGQSWRVPTFWRGGQQWTVRFAPPAPGEYTYRVQSTDGSNPDLNGHEGRVKIGAYRGSNDLLRRGPLRVSANNRYLEHADGTPFYWLGDTWWTGLSDRLNWDGFKKLTADRKAKGFTVVQIVGGLIPSNEEKAPSDPGFCNEGGCVYDAQFQRINPHYFDYADRRVQHLIEAGITPAMVGAWRQMAEEMGAAKLKKHWRYLIARYSAYPMFWIVAGEVLTPPGAHPRIDDKDIKKWKTNMAVWEDVARYVRTTDPYHHPITLHEANPPLHGGFPDQSLTDFDMVFPSHLSWWTLGTEVAQVNLLYSRTPNKPVVVGEIGYEQLGGEHLHDFQRAAFWLAMLNGAAGHTYGTIETAEAYSTDKPLHRYRWSFATWEEAMNLPGSRQVGINAGLLRQYPWHRFAPHPEWVTPRGTTLFEPNSDVRQFDLDVSYAYMAAQEKSSRPPENEVPSGEWQKRNGNFREPYAAGIPGEIRIIYIPHFGVFAPAPPTVLNLEPEVRYHAYYWDTTLGIKVDLGTVARPQPGQIIFKDKIADRKSSSWEKQTAGKNQSLSLAKGIHRKNLMLSAASSAAQDLDLILRYKDAGNFVAASYSAAEKAIFIRQWADGKEGHPLGKTDVTISGAQVRLSAELRNEFAIVSISDGEKSMTSPIVSLTADPFDGGFGVMQGSDLNGIDEFEARESPTLAEDEALERKLYDTNGIYRGEMSGIPEWDNYGKNKAILLDAYRPERAPFPQDWVLVLENKRSPLKSP